MKYDVFISYSRADFDEVNGFVELLKRQIPSLSVWFDITGIESGDEFEEKIIAAIDQSRYVIFALSDNSINSQWAKDEVMYAKHTEKRVIPVLLRGAELKGWFLFKFGRVDCIDSTIPLQVNKLVKNISKWVGKPVVKKAQSEVQKEPTEQSQTIAEEKPAPQPPTPPAPTQPTTNTYKVGDYYDDGVKQGVVFDVWDGGRHGKIVSLDQAKLSWADDSDWSFCFNKNSPIRKTVGCCNFNDGMANMIMIRQIVGWRDKYPAFVWCCSKGKDWYLPAINELELLLLNDSVLDAVNCALNKYGKSICVSKKYCYWSSTEDERRYSYGIEPYSGWISGHKMNDYHVRAVATF